MYELVFRPSPDSTTHGFLCIRDTSNHYDHPIRQQVYWPASGRAYIGDVLNLYPDLANGPLPLERRGSGRFIYRRGIIEREIHIYGGNQTAALAVDEERIPQPKTRTETRYRAGRWEKYLKTQGWVIA